MNTGALDFLLFYSDGLHLAEKDNLKLSKSILKAIDSNGNANPYENAACFTAKNTVISPDFLVWKFLWKGTVSA